jgi:hypothetical protein
MDYGFSMNNKMVIFALLSSFLLIYPSLSFSDNSKTASYNNSFNSVKQGKLPEGWVIDETLSQGWFSSFEEPGKVASWAVIQDINSPNKKILAITNLNKSARSVFNIIYTKNIKFKNGDISVKVRANSGNIDQGGGPIWRFKDKNNYYVARYNPLEENFRIYYVKDGNRTQLKSASNLGVETNEWFTIKIKHQNNLITGWLNGKKLLDVKDDTFDSSGGVGLWTKADAISEFDDFNVKENK